MADPDMIVKECMEGSNRVLAEHLRRLLEYCQGEEFAGSSPATRQKHYHTLRGFYMCNLVALPRYPLRVGSLPGVVARRETTAQEFLSMLKRVLETVSLSPRDRSIILTAVQTGMNASTLAGVFNFHGFPQPVKQFGTEDFWSWDCSKCPVRLDLLRPKSLTLYYTFMDVDGVEALKAWLAVRTQTYGPMRIYPPEAPNGLPKSDPIYVRGDGSPIQPHTVGVVFRQAGKRASINLREGVSLGNRGARIRYPFHSHEVRDTIITLARRVGAIWLWLTGLWAIR